jgi:hypothetical protein
MKLTCTTTGRGIYGSGGGLAITFGNIEFGAMPSGYYHIDAQDGCRIQATANYTISAGITSGMHIYCNGGHVLITGRTITLTGTPAFSVFLRCIFTGVVEAQTASFSGSATGSRYDAFGCGVIYTNGGGSSFFPGSSAGSTATGGQYL